ncbi:NAD(P)/FAD-dependent oxidoreductase [Aquiflexum gelatinilyticum]|uniref:NAD(P)/FAD-dependent oxidoreductase n=1 Tax=Aquiflexum gelatinilyticum TaxID=2961943 RepID=UPI0021694EC4|nr:FAD-dependent oxidoreductase [Aquiflexum gelatinilyticum]MCS4433462.1 FAD-binding oxidoreductase [Aquiflexum gelatinilyticum]
MRIRTFEPFWLVKNGLLNSYPSLQKNIETEIVVLGGGITGALVSYALMEAGHKVVLIDKRDIGQGSTSATTSMLQYEIDEPLVELSKKIGEKGAVTCYKAGIKAIRTIGDLVGKLNLDCGFELKKSLYLAHDIKAADWLKEEFEMRNKHRMGVSWLSDEQVLKTFGVRSFGAILSKTAASVDAYQLAHGLIRHSFKRGMEVYDQTEISKTEHCKDGVVLQTAEGFSVQCKKVIYCTGFESTDLLKEKVAKLFYTYASVSEQGIACAKQLKDILVWDTADPYLYMRTTEDGRLLVGGEDSSTNFPFFQQQIKERKHLKLQSKLDELIPENGFIEDFSWGGTFGSTKDGLPYIGASPEYKNALFVLGFGGNGITFSIQAMEIIVSMLKGKKHNLEKYYKFGR